MSRKRSIDSESDAPTTPPTARYGPMHALVALGRADWTSYLAMLTEDVAACVLSPYLTTAGGTRCWPGVVRDPMMLDGDATSVLPASAEPEKTPLVSCVPAREASTAEWTVHIEPDNSVVAGDRVQLACEWHLCTGANWPRFPRMSDPDAPPPEGAFRVYDDRSDTFYTLMPRDGVVEVAPRGGNAHTRALPTALCDVRNDYYHGVPRRIGGRVRVHAACVDGAGRVCVAYRRDGTDTTSCIVVIALACEEYCPILEMTRHDGGQICAMAVDAMGDLAVVYRHGFIESERSEFSLGVVRTGGRWPEAEPAAV
jgi:hypothetical protein